jgi:hypothetical protein
VLPDECLNIIQILRRREDKGSSVVLVEAFEHLLEEGFVAVVMDVDIYQPALSGLAEQSSTRGSEEENRTQYCQWTALPESGISIYHTV